MEFSRQEYWSGLPFSSPGDLSGPGIEPSSLALACNSLPLSHQGSPLMQFTWVFKTTLTEESSPELGDGDFWKWQESSVPQITMSSAYHPDPWRGEEWECFLSHQHPLHPLNPCCYAAPSLSQSRSLSSELLVEEIPSCSLSQ